MKKVFQAVGAVLNSVGRCELRRQRSLSLPVPDTGVALSLLRDPEGHVVVQVICMRMSQAEWLTEVLLQELPSEKGSAGLYHP